MNSSGHAIAVWYRIKDLGDGRDEYTMRATKRAPGKGFGEPFTLGAAAQAIAPNQPSAPRVAIDNHGNAVAAWLVKDADGKLRVVAAFKPRGGSFGEPRMLSAPGQPAFDPDVAFDHGDRAIVTWERVESGLPRVQAAIKPAGSAQFGDPETLSASTLNAAFPRVGMSDGGRAFITWSARDPDPSSSGHHFVQVATRPEHGSFDAPQTISNPDLDADRPQLAVAGDGEAIVAWNQGDPAIPDPGDLATAFAAKGDPFKPLTPIAGEKGLEPFVPDVGIDERGHATLLWAESPPQATDGPRVIRSAHLDEDGHYGRFQELDRTSNPVSLLQPSLAVSPAGTAVASWIRSTLSVDPVATPVDVAVRREHDSLFGATGALTPGDASGQFPATAATAKLGIVVWPQGPVGGDPTTLEASVDRGLGH